MLALVCICVGSHFVCIQLRHPVLKRLKDSVSICVETHEKVIKVLRGVDFRSARANCHSGHSNIRTIEWVKVASRLMNLYTRLFHIQYQSFYLIVAFQEKVDYLYLIHFIYAYYIHTSLIFYQFVYFAAGKSRTAS